MRARRFSIETCIQINNLTHSTHRYYYMSRFMFAFYLIAFFFAHIALLTGLLALFSRLGGYRKLHSRRRFGHV